MPSNNDFIIAFDEDGKPYIAHGLLSNLRSRFLKNRSGSTGKSQQRSPRPNHKYIMRIDDNGRRRYFYTREQIQAYYKSKKDKEAAVNDKNQNESSLQDTAKKAVSSARDQLKDLSEEAKKAVNEAKTEEKSASKPAQSSSPKPSTGIAEYARRKAAEANSPRTKSTPASSEEDDVDESDSKKSTKSKESTKSETSSGSSGRRSSSGSSRGSAQQSASVTQSPSAMIQQALDARKTANVSLTSMDEFDDTIAKAAKNLEGADKYEAYKRAVDAFKANPTRENALKRNQLKQEWLATPHGKYVSSISSELQKKKQVNDPKMLLKNLTSVPKNNSTSSLVSLFLNNTRR